MQSYCKLIQYYEYVDLADSNGQQIIHKRSLRSICKTNAILFSRKRTKFAFGDEEQRRFDELFRTCSFCRRRFTTCCIHTAEKFNTTIWKDKRSNEHITKKCILNYGIWSSFSVAFGRRCSALPERARYAKNSQTLSRMLGSKLETSSFRCARLCRSCSWKEAKSGARH